MHAGSVPDISEQELEIHPLERAETIPASWYTNPQFHELERELIFAQTWQHIGHASRLQVPGDQIIGEAAGNPIIIVRGNDNESRAFYNVCRHRGGPLAMEDCRTKVLQCKYHGWTYLLDGSLRGTPKFDRTELFDKKDFGLIPVRHAVWEDMVFVNLSDNSTPLHSMVEGIVDRLHPMRLSGKSFFKRINYEVHCNWKVYIDNYLEGYHLPFVHPELTNMLDFQNYVTETFGYYSLQYSRITQEDNLYGAKDERAYYFFIWPNFMLNILPGRVQTNTVVPVSHNHTRVIFDYYYDDVTSGKALKMIHEDIEYSDKVQREDAEICERVQKGLASRAYHKGRFSPEMENGVYHFQTLLKKAYREARK
jgi:choline monooxygenase